MVIDSAARQIEVQLTLARRDTLVTRVSRRALMLEDQYFITESRSAEEDSGVSVDD